MTSSMEQAEIPHLHGGEVKLLEDTEADLTTVKNEPATTEKDSADTLTQPEMKLESIEGVFATAKDEPGTTEQDNKSTLDERDVVPKKNMVYFASWDIYGRNYQPRDIPVQNVTHIIYAFANVHPDGTVTPGGGDADTVARGPADPADPAVGIYAYGCVGQLAELKRACRHIKVLLSIGGPACSPNFASAAGSAENRKRFARTASSLMWDWGFDGIDVDWEHPASAAESENMLLLLADVRARLDFYSKMMTTDYRLLLTMTVGAGRQHLDAMSAHLGRMAALVDAVGLMGYDFCGDWDVTSGHQANLRPSQANPAATPYSVERAVADCLALGVPADRLVLGMPLYGRSFENTAGPGRDAVGVGADGSFGEAAVWDYKALPRPGAVEAVDAEAVAAYSYDEATRQLVSYDNVETVAAKAAYIREVGLAGAMFWEASGDREGELSLVAASSHGLGELDRSPNWLDYPESPFENVNGGMEE